jgi:hypothetical protein
VEAAVYFCCAEASRAAVNGCLLALSVAGDDLVLQVAGASARDFDMRAIRDRVGVVDGSVTTGDELITLTIPLDPARSHASTTSRGPGF